MIEITALSHSDVNMNDLAWGLSTDLIEAMPDTSEDAINAVLISIGQEPVACTAADDGSDTLAVLSEDCKVLTFLSDGAPHVFMFTEV